MIKFTYMKHGGINVAGIKTVQSVDRAIMILKCFSEKKKELKLSEIAEEVSLNKSTTHGIVSTLKHHQLLDQNPDSQKYKLGLFLMQLGDLVADSMDVIKIAHPFIVKISEQIDETVHLASLDKLEVVYIQKEEPFQAMRVSTYVGARNPAHCTAVGKVLLAYMGEEQLSLILPQILDRYTPYTINLKTELLREFQLIRARGYSIDNEELLEGVTCVAAPIFDNSGVARYSISITGPSFRMNAGKIDSGIALVQKAAIEISNKLGYIGNK